MKNKVYHYSKILLPYLILLIASIISLYIFLYDGLPGGDDAKFHLSQSYDIYFGMKNGFFGLSTDHLTLGSLGYNSMLFYGPLSHYSIALLTYLFDWTGLDIIGSYKIIAFISVFVSAIFAYLLSKRISKNIYIGLMGGMLFTFMPYRIFCTLCRAAYAETLAMAFIPIIFYGIYRVLNDEKPAVFPYISLIIGIAGIILSHPFTAISTLTFVVIYVLFNIKKLIKVVKNLKTVIYALVSVGLIIGLVSFYIFPLFEAQSSGLYTISDNIIMWTNVAHVGNSTANSWMFSGFLNFVYITSKASLWPTISSPDAIGLSILFFALGVGLCVATDFFIKKGPYSIYYRFIGDLLALLLLTFFLPRLELILALVVFYIAFVFLMVFKDYVPHIEKQTDEFSIKSIYKNIDIYFLVFSLIVVLILILNKDVWSYVPEIYLQSQFAWRLWSLFSFFITFLAVYVFTYLIKYRYSIVLGFALTSMLVVVTQATLEKRMGKETNAFWYSVIDEDYCKRVTKVGVMNEYAPLCFSDSDYVPTYANGYYYYVRNMLKGQAGFFYDMSSYPNPAFVSGAGSFAITSLNTPNITLTGSVTSDTARIQIMQFYYDGYKIELTNLSDNKVTITPAIYADGLIAFDIPKGDYNISITYPGPQSYQIGVVALYLSLGGLLAFGGYGIATYYLKRKKEMESK